jgi:hypothetical protein
MRKLVLFFPIVAMLTVSACKQEEVVVALNPLGAAYESLMNESRLWQLSRVESAKARNYIHIFPNPEKLEFDTVEVSGTDWLSQVKAAAASDENFPIDFIYSFDFSAAGDVYNASLDMNRGKSKDDEFALAGWGFSKAPGDYSVFSIKLRGQEKPIYGYHSEESIDGDDEELWTNFKATKAMISFRVEKVYNDTTYLVDVEFTPVD